MNQIARSNTRKAIHSLVSALDEHDEDQQRLRDLILRFHTGRWPLFRCLGMRKVNGSIIEAVEWLRSFPARYSVIYWQADGLGLSWVKARGRRHATAMLNDRT